MLQDHKDTIQAFEKEEQSGQDPQAKAFAKATLPTLHKHLKKIEAVAKTLLEHRELSAAQLRKVIRDAKKARAPLKGE